MMRTTTRSPREVFTWSLGDVELGGIKALPIDEHPFEAERLTAERKVERLVAKALTAVWEGVKRRLKAEDKKEWGEKHLPGKHDQRTHGRGGGSHLISKGETSVWLSDSVNKKVTFHHSSGAGAQSLVKDGVNIEGSAKDGMFGKGFYTTSSETTSGGTGGPLAVKRVEVAVKLKKPVVASADDIFEEVFKITGQRRVDRGKVLKAGYDGIIVNFSWGETWAVAFKDESVKVVV